MITFMAMVLSFNMALQANIKRPTITLGRVQTINALFERDMRGEINLPSWALRYLIKEYHRPIKR